MNDIQSAVFQLAVSGRTTFQQSMVLFFSSMLLIGSGSPRPKLNYMLVGHYNKLYFILCMMLDSLS